MAAISTTQQIQGRSIVAGKVADASAGSRPPAERTFYATDPKTGQNLQPAYFAAADEDVDNAAWAAWQAFHAILDRPTSDRATLLETIADTITALGDDLLKLAARETALAPVRLVAEHERMITTLRMFAAALHAGDWVEAVIDLGQATRRPTPRPDLRRMLRPLGPIAVFGAGNFPLAYSAAGGDTASALAAGCPVVIKGHPGHPGTGEVVAHAIAAAVQQCGFPPGTFSYLLAGGDREMTVGERLVQHPAIRAVGFTGSLAGGMALDRLARERPDPIPIFAEMGSTNPIFVLPGAMASEAELIADSIIGSATARAGQMCTSPGIIFMRRGAALEGMLAALAKRMDGVAPITMLNARTRRNFLRRANEIGSAPGVELLAGTYMELDAKPADEPGPIMAQPALFKTTFDTFRKNADLRDECFGPASLVVICDDDKQLLDAAASIQGSLTATIWAGADDVRLARQLQFTLEQRVGRLIYNGVPTGVEVVNAMVHGGPFPATNQQHITAVGLFAIKRWARPVCYQNVPDGLLPAELRNANPLGIRRLVDGEWTDRPLNGKPE